MVYHGLVYPCLSYYFVRVSTILLVVQDFSHMQTQLSGSHRPRQSNCHQLGELQGPKLFKSKQKINHTVYVILVD
jgi:hypothetical protein